MRDGLHKSLPLGRHWQRFLKRCEREVEHGALAERDASIALERDVRDEMSSDFRRLLATLVEPTEALLPVVDVEVHRLAVTTCENRGPVFQRDVSRRLLRDLARSRTPDVHVALSGAVLARRDRRIRQIEQHAIKGGAPPEILEEARRAALAVDCDSLATRVLGTDVAPKPAPPDPLRLDDEDMR